MYYSIATQHKIVHEVETKDHHHVQLIMNHDYCTGERGGGGRGGGGRGHSTYMYTFPFPHTRTRCSLTTKFCFFYCDEVLAQATSIQMTAVCWVSKCVKQGKI